MIESWRGNVHSSTTYYIHVFILIAYNLSSYISAKTVIAKLIIFQLLFSLGRGTLRGDKSCKYDLKYNTFVGTEHFFFTRCYSQMNFLCDLSALNFIKYNELLSLGKVNTFYLGIALCLQSLDYYTIYLIRIKNITKVIYFYEMSKIGNIFLFILQFTLSINQVISLFSFSSKFHILLKITIKVAKRNRNRIIFNNS